MNNLAPVKQLVKAVSSKQFQLENEPELEDNDLHIDNGATGNEPQSNYSWQKQLLLRNGSGYRQEQQLESRLSAVIRVGSDQPLGIRPVQGFDRRQSGGY